MTFADLVSMKIRERKALALEILARDGGMREREHLVSEWGRFSDAAPATEREIDLEAERLLSLMTLRQKVGQMTPNTSVEDYVPACIKYNDAPYYAGEDLDLEIPGIKFTDGPTGIVMGDSSTCFPVSIARGASWDPELEREIGEAIGEEARSLGANLFAGVCVNLLRHPAWGRSQETYGEDPHLLSAMGSALVRGVQTQVMACVKHFALNSMENARYRVDVGIDERSLREVYLPHFKACIDSGAASVMAAYNKVRGEYCGHNSHLVSTILRKEWGFEGIVISDFVYGIRDGRKAVEAGMDIEMPIPGQYGENLVDLVERGDVAESLVDESVRRILKTKMRFASRLGGTPLPASFPACPGHVAIAKKAALESAVLLRNRGNTLPFDRALQKKLAVVGRLASIANVGDTKGSSRVYPPYVVTPLQGIRDYAGSDVEIVYSEGRDAESLAETLDGADAVVVVVGLCSDDEGEYIPHWNTGCGGDRVSLGLKESDVDLIMRAAGLCDRVVVVLQGGGAIMTAPWDERVGAILMTWYPGMEGGRALAEILYGDHNPSGKLPVTIPRSHDQLPPFDREADRANYGFFHGYFLADLESHQAAYPFGFGLSYTTYAYSDLSVSDAEPGVDDEIEVSVLVRNTGSRPGVEIVQVYAGCERSAFVRHVKDLRGFGRLSLEPGEAARFTRALRIRDLARYDVDTGTWMVERTTYRIWAGASSRPDDLLSTPITVR